MEGWEWTLHKNLPTGTQAVQPSIQLHAEKAVHTMNLDTEESVFNLTNVEADIQREDDDPVTLTAGAGTFDQNKESVDLSKEVRIHVGNMSLAAKSVIWDNAAGTVTSNSRIELKNGASNLEATAFEMNPGEDTLNLKNTTGTLILGDNPS